MTADFADFADRAAAPESDDFTDRLWEEIVYIGYYLHWSFDSILELDHASRARVIKEIGRINALLSAGSPVPAPRGDGFFPL